MTAPRRGAAQERSPGRSPGFVFVLNPAPEGRKTWRTSFAPSGLSVSLQAYPGLAPGATFLSRSAAGNIVNSYRSVQSPVGGPRSASAIARSLKNAKRKRDSAQPQKIDRPYSENYL